MTYAVVYHSETGNTKAVAEAIYQSLPAGAARLYETTTLQTAPEADVYFVGFSVRNRTCGIETMNFLDQIKGGKIALFATCGFCPVDAYREQLEQHLAVWLPERAEYLGMFLCQGKVSSERAQKMIQEMPQAQAKMEDMFQRGLVHPDAEDLHEAQKFAQNIQVQCGEAVIGC